MCFIQVRFGIYPGEHAAIPPLGLWERVQSLTWLGQGNGLESHWVRSATQTQSLLVRCSLYAVGGGSHRQLRCRPATAVPGLFP